MQNRAFTISICAAVFAVMLVDNYVTTSIEDARREFGAQRAVVVAKRDIHELDMLDESNLELKDIPAKFMEPGSSDNDKDFRGALAVAPIAKGEQVTRSKITTMGPRPGLARQIASGKRAVTIPVSDVTAVAKLLKPGDRVDVIATVDPSGSGNKLMLESRVILQDRLILATGKYVTNTLPGILEVDPYGGKNKHKVPLAEYMGYTTVTLEVEASQMTTLIFAAKNLDLYLALRNNDETGQGEEYAKTTMKDFLGGAALPAKAALPPAGPPAKK